VLRPRELPGAHREVPQRPAPGERRVRRLRGARRARRVRLSSARRGLWRRWPWAAPPPASG
jgi:hypothetical protein